MNVFNFFLTFQDTFSSSSRMLQLKQQPQIEDIADPLLTAQEMQFWLDKAVAWGQAETVETQRDTCQHMSRLRDFIQQLLKHINSMVSYREKRFMWLKCFDRLWSTLSYDAEWTSFTLNQLGQAGFWCIRQKMNSHSHSYPDHSMNRVQRL